jgi:AAA domain
MPLSQEQIDGVFASFSDEQANERKARGNGNGHGKGRRHFTLKPFDTIKLSTRPNYLVKGVLPRTGLAVVWGPPKCGKSFLTYDMMMHVALGWEYRGRRVQQGGVVYCALEGGQGFAARVEAWRCRHLSRYESEPVPFWLLDMPLDLVADHAGLIESIRLQLGDGPPPAAIVIDTLNRALMGDENKSDDMAKLIRAADFLRAAFGCLVILVHHCGVAGNRPRGHTSLAGADDVQLAVERNKDDGNITITIEHMKDGDASAPMASKLERVELGNDDDGDPITSCVIVPAELAAKGPKLSKVNRFALDLLQKLIAAEGVPPPRDSGLPDHVRLYPAGKWRERFNERYPADKRDTKKKAYLRAVLDLQEAELIELWREFVWLRDNGTKRDK